MVLSAIRGVRSERQTSFVIHTAVYTLLSTGASEETLEDFNADTTCGLSSQSDLIQNQS